MNVLQEILNILALATSSAQMVAPLTGGAAADVQAGAAIANSLLAIAQKATSAYEAHTGEPLDLSLLHPIDEVK
jgi:ribosomal protein S12 methylthiotransferase accessory factor YcaO